MAYENPAEAALLKINEAEFANSATKGELSDLLTQATKGPDLSAGLQDARDAASQQEASFKRGLGRRGTTLTRDQWMARDKTLGLADASTAAGIAHNTRGGAREFQKDALAQLSNIRQGLVEKSQGLLGSSASNANARNDAYRAEKAAQTSQNKQMAMQGVMMLAMMSSREYKDDIKAYDPSKALDTVEGLDLVQFTYKEGIDALPGTHVGLIAEDAPDIIATEDHKALNAYNMIGILLGAVQELSTQVRDLKGAK